MCARHCRWFIYYYFAPPLQSTTAGCIATIIQPNFDELLSPLHVDRLSNAVDGTAVVNVARTVQCFPGKKNAHLIMLLWPVKLLKIAQRDANASDSNLMHSWAEMEALSKKKSCWTTFGTSFSASSGKWSFCVCFLFVRCKWLINVYFAMWHCSE